jgi:CRP-like cAMP-binding protein
MVSDAHLKMSDPGLALLRMLEEEHIGQNRKMQRGRMLCWQGDPVECIYVIRIGAIKVFSTSPDGKTYAYGVIGPGGVVGVTSHLLGSDQEMQAEALEDIEVIAIQPVEFERLLAVNPRFSLLVMRKLAEGLSSLASKARDFGLLDVQQRLKHWLVEYQNRSFPKHLAGSPSSLLCS